MAFPYKREFVDVSPSEFFRRLQHGEKLIEGEFSQHRETPSDQFPRSILISPDAYERVDIITDLFTEEARVRAKVYDSLSPLEYWELKRTEIEKLAQKDLGKKATEKAKLKYYREYIYKQSKEATGFKASLSKFVYDTFLPGSEGRVLDPFSGWGDRAIGALASSEVKHYSGVDVNENLKPGYSRIQAELDPEKKLSFNFTPFERFESKEKFDLIFTSPPFFDYEIYALDSTQSVSGKSSYQDWFEGWMVKVLERMSRLIKPGRYIILYMGNTSRTPSLCEDVRAAFLKLGVQLVKSIPCSVGKKRPVFLWVYGTEAKAPKTRVENAPSYFPRGKEVVEAINYTDVTLAYMTPYSKAVQIARMIELLRPLYVVDATAGIGGTTLGFSSIFRQVISYEKERDRWQMLCNNLTLFDRKNVLAYNQEFEWGEDVQLLDISDENINSKTVVYFDPPWIEVGKSIDKSNYRLTGIQVTGNSLEVWCKYLVNTKKVLAVVLHLPKDYHLNLAGVRYLQLDTAKLAFFTSSPLLESEVGRDHKLLTEERVVEEVTSEVEVKMPSYERPLDVIPGPAAVRGPKIQLQTYLTPNFPYKRYAREIFNPKVIHLGQRKLFLSEVEFLTRIHKHRNDLKYTLLYVGAAPGIHIPLLSEMFPEVSFILYDPAEFAIKPTSRIEIHRKLFTPELVGKYSQIKNLLFVSDIRTAPTHLRKGQDAAYDQEFEKEVARNLGQQREWVEGLKPVRSLLKFRLPFTEEEDHAETEYFDGILHFQAYAKTQSAETRLEVPQKLIYTKYNHTRYEQQMFYFNTEYRVQGFQHYDAKYGWTYDTIREFFIYVNYLKLQGKSANEIPGLFARADKFSTDASKSVSAMLERYSRK